MRVHKYRAWHEENKMMYYSHRPDGSDNPLWSWDVAFRKDWHDGKGLVDTGAVKMEWIGLKDKSHDKKEIYEGDIVSFMDSEFNKRVGKVVYDCDDYLPCFCIEWEDGNLEENFETAVVIGNEFENPELLK